MIVAGTCRWFPNKICFETKKEVKTMKHERWRDKKVKLDFYKCTHCPYYHLTSIKNSLKRNEKN